MRDAMPTMRSVMTPFPCAVGPEETPERARELMAEHAIHHVPVVAAGGDPVGLLTPAALAAAARGETVGDLPLLETLVVDIAAPLDAVLVALAERRLDAAIVVKGGRLAGIFTLGDACRRFAALLREVYPPAPRGDSAA